MSVRQENASASPSRAPPRGGRRRGEGRALPLLLGLPVALWQGVLFVVPLVFLAVLTFWRVRNFRLEPDFVFDNWNRVLDSVAFSRALVHTFEVAATTTVLAMLFAFPIAHAIVFRLSPRLRDLAVAFLIVPIFASYTLRAYAWQIVLSPDGLINSVLKAMGYPALPLLGGALSLQIGLLTFTMPIAVLILVFGFAGFDRSLIDAARNLGATGGRIVLNVLIPGIRPALLLAATSVFLLAFGDYISPVFLTGSKPPTLSILIVDTIKSGSQWPRGSVIGVSMLLILACVFALGQVVGRIRFRRFR